MANTEVIPVRMKENTIKQMDRIQERVNAPSRSDAVRRAIELSNILLTAVEHGERIILEDRNGKQRQVLITGLHSSE